MTMIKKLIKKLTPSNTNDNNTEEILAEHGSIDRRKQYENPKSRYVIVRVEESTIIYALNDLTFRINNMLANGYVPVGSPQVKRDSTKRQIFIAFQGMIKNGEK